MYKLTIDGSTAVYTDGTEKISLSLPASDCIGIVEPEGAPRPSQDYSFADEITKPKYGKSLRELVKEKDAQSASIIISDSTRHVPNDIALPVIIDELRECGMELSSITVFVALGVHRPATEEEIRQSVGEKYYGKVKVVNPEPNNDSTLIFLGTTSYGTPVKVNSAAYMCDLHISIGKVEPHCFAGYSGGRKSVLPGIASAETILKNHSYENITDKYSVPGELENNRIHLDMLEAAGLYRIDFSVQFVVTEELVPSAVFSGEMISSHNAAVSYLEKYLTVEITEKPDIIVVATGAPKNINLYQATTSFVPLFPFVDKDCVVVLTCEAREGVDSEDMKKPFINSGSLDEIERKMKDNYNIQMDSAVFTLRLLRDSKKVIVYSPNLKDEEIELFKMVPCSNQRELMPLAYKHSGKSNPRVLFMPRPQAGLVKVCFNTP